MLTKVNWQYYYIIKCTNFSVHFYMYLCLHCEGVAGNLSLCVWGRSMCVLQNSHHIHDMLFPSRHHLPVCSGFDDELSVCQIEKEQ